jgi:hypothetical protein
LIAIYSRRNGCFSCGNFYFSGWNNDDSTFQAAFASGTKPLPAGITTIPAGTEAIPAGMRAIPAGQRLSEVEIQFFLPASGQFLSERE